LSAVIWLVRLEGKVKQMDRLIAIQEREMDALRVKHENLDSKIVESLGQIRESLARLEGRLHFDEGR